MTVGEGDYPYVESSTFADDIKYHGGAWQSDFHFVTNPFIAEGVASDYKISTAKHNLTDGVSALVQWLSGRNDGTDYLNSYIYKYIQNTLFPGNENVAKSYALRLLIHYVGDIHQPFHNEAMYSTQFPTGDKGGNLITLPSHYSSDELHAVWDQQMYSEHNHISRPINQTAWNTFQPRVVSLMASGASAVAKASEYQNTDIATWVQQSYDISKTLYDGVVINTALSQEYINNGLTICNERITLGGYRLAYLTEYIFATAAE